MLHHIKDPYYSQYLPIVWGVTVVVSSLIGLVILAYKSVDISVFLYLSIVAVFAGIVLQIRSERVIYIRIYQIMIMCLQSVIFLSGAILLLTEGQQLGMKLFVTTMLAIVSLGLGTFFFFRTRRLYTPTMPYGPVGLMNSKTGEVDPSKSPQKIQKQIDKYNGKMRLVWKLIPLTAGLSLALVGVLSVSAKELVWAIVAIMVVAGDFVAIGSLMAYAIASLRWERENGKQIIVRY